MSSILNVAERYKHFDCLKATYAQRVPQNDIRVLSVCLFVCLFDCLFGVLRPSRECFTHMETSPLPVKDFKF